MQVLHSRAGAAVVACAGCLSTPSKWLSTPHAPAVVVGAAPSPL